MISDSNARLAAARRLISRSSRRTAGRFLAEGAPAVREALTRPDVVVEVFATAEALDRHFDLLSGAEVPVAEVSVRAAAALSETVSPQGLVAVCQRLDVSAGAAFGRRPPLAVALVEPNDPGNLGTIIRTADAAGAGVVAVVGGVDVYNGKAVRASAGSLFHVDVVVDESATEVLAAARSGGLACLATSGAGDLPLADVALANPTLWLFGTEAHGLPDEVVSAADASVRVPIYGAAESLNVAATAAVCLYASAAAQHEPR